MFHPAYQPTIQGKLYLNSLHGGVSSVCDDLCSAGFDAKIHSPIPEERQFAIDTAIDDLVYAVAYAVHVGFKGVPQSDYPEAMEVEKARKQLLMAINNSQFYVAVRCDLSDVPYVSSDSEDEDIIANFGADVSKALPEENFELQEITINRDC